MSFFADTAILLSPKSPAVEGKENIRKVWHRMLMLPGPGLSFSAATVEVARSGDLAWEQGTYEFTTKDKNAKAPTEKGTYVTVWKKQPSGAWTVVGPGQPDGTPVRSFFERQACTGHRRRTVQFVRIT